MDKQHIDLEKLYETLRISIPYVKRVQKLKFEKDISYTFIEYNDDLGRIYGDLSIKLDVGLIGVCLYVLFVFIFIPLI